MNLHSMARKKGSREATSASDLTLRFRRILPVDRIPPTLLIGVAACSILIGFGGGGGNTSASTPVGPAVLISQATSTRAIALESVAFTSEPFMVNSPFSWADDRRTRIILFALNLITDDASAVSADGEDSTHRHYALTVEYVGAVPGNDWMNAVVVRLSDDLSDVGDLLVRVRARGFDSNRVRVGIGHIGGGLPDDPGGAPTPAPPYSISGNVSASEQLTGVTVNLTGPENRTVTADANGNYSFTVNTVGNYEITPRKPSFVFTPSSRSVAHVTNNQSNLNFTAVRQGFTVSGRVTAEGHGIEGIVTVLRSEPDSTEARTTTAADGTFLFAGKSTGNYSLRALDTSVFTFQPPVAVTLTGDMNVNLSSTRLTYTITGRIVDRFNRPLSARPVTLTGGQNTTTNTDTAGNYSFANLPAGFGYTITPSPTISDAFAPQTLAALTANTELNFTGSLRTYTISGRITAAGGVGAGGVKVTLSGSQSAETRTAGDGSFSFDARVGGTYTITPSIEQAAYTFSPSAETLESLFDNQTVNFFATLTAVPDQQHVLEFDGSPMTVDYGNFWPPATNLGHFFWEFWARPDAFFSPGYLISDGYGGAHSLLFGVANFNQSEPGRHLLLGDINDGVIDITHVFYFGGDQGPEPGEWAHFAVGWDGRSVICYYNGVPVGKMAFTGPRQSPRPDAGGGRLLIGGSDHLNFKGRIAQVRGYEGSNPREDQTGLDPTLPEAAFTPETVFSIGGNLLSHYFRPATAVADLSNGYGGTHIGTPRGTTAGILDDCGSCPGPRFVIDPTAPNFATGTPPAPLPGPSPVPIPTGTLVFDSFSRSNSTYTFGSSGGLGATEGGSSGTPAWQYSDTPSARKPFGILNGRAVMLANNTYMTWVPTGGSPNLDVRVDRHPGSWESGLDTGLSFRVQDANTYFFAYTTENPRSPTRRKVVAGYKIGQVVNQILNASMPDNWTTLRVVTTSSGRIDVYADSTLVSSVINNLLSGASGAGLYNNARGLGLTNRWDNFTVYPVP